VQLEQLRMHAQNESRSRNVVQLALDTLASVRKAETDVPWLAWLRSLYLLRNCLAHRSRIVGPNDVRNGLLSARWRRHSMVVGGVVIDQLPFYTEQGGELGIRTDDEERSWRVGEVVHLSARDCSDVALTLIAFCQDFARVTSEGVALLLGAGIPSTGSGPSA
jgi:hypothetical protein